MLAGQYTFRNLLNNGTSASSQTPASEEEVSSLLQRDSKKVSRPMKPDGWWKEGDNFLDTDSWGSENKGAIRSEASHPTIWLKRTKEEMRLCVYQLRTVTLIMLVPTCSSVNGLDGFALLRGQLLEKVGILLSMSTCLAAFSSLELSDSS